MDNFRLGFREVIPDQTLPEKWKEITLNTGGTQSTLQDIKLPERAGGYFYEDASKNYMRNRFICWRVSQDTLEVVERSLEVRLSGGRVRWRGGGALLGASVHELPDRILLLATSVCSVHRFVFPHPDIIHRQIIKLTMDNFRLGFREVIPDQTLPEKWKEITLNTGGTQSTLQDIKLPERAGGYFYEDASKNYMRNRFICWRVSQDTLEVVERSLEVRLSGGRVRWRGGGALLGASVHELPDRILLLATSVCSVHRFVFPHPDIIHRQESIGRDLEDTSPSILNEASAAQASDPKHFHIISHNANANSVFPQTCAMAVHSSGEALYALAGVGPGGGATGILLVRLSAAGAAHTTLLRQDSIVPRFLSALRGNRGNDGEAACGLVLKAGQGSAPARLYALGRDARLRAWCCERSTCIAVHPLLPDQNDNLTQGAQSHMLRAGETSSGELLLGAFLCFSVESHFTVFKPVQADQNIVKFMRVCHLFGPERDLVDFSVCGGGVWAAWGGGGGVVTASALGPAARWARALPAPPPPAPLPPQPNHHAYLDCLFAPGLFPLAVIAKALSIYERSGDAANSTLNQSTRDQTMLEVESEGEGGVQALRRRALAAVCCTEQQRAARTQLQAQDLTHKCWSELYSWCVQYLEGWRKPQGLVLSNHENGGWCVLLRRGGISFMRPLELLEHLYLSEDPLDLPTDESCTLISSELSVSRDVCWVVMAAGSVGRLVSEEVKAEVRAGLAAGRAPNLLLPELAAQLMANGEDGEPPIFTPAVLAALSRKLSSVTDLPQALLALNHALRLDCQDLEDCDDEEHQRSGLESIFSSDMGVSLATEALYQMAEVRFSICCNLLVLGAVLAGSRSHSVWPVAGHTGVSLQAYSSLCWLCETTLGQPEDHNALKSSMERLSLLKLSDASTCDLAAGLGSSPRVAPVAWWFARGAGGRGARRLLACAPPPLPRLHWSRLLQPYVTCLGHLMWGVSGGFSLGSWLAGAGRPRLVQSYAALLAPWCEWNSCSREFIVGMSLLDTGEPQKALEAFQRAGQGVTSEPFLARLLPHSNDSPRHSLLNYYLKVIKLFELHKAPECIISLAETAIKIADKDDPHLSIFHSLLFRTWLALGAWERALESASGHPVGEQRANCLGRLVAALGARRALPRLLAPGAPPPPSELCGAAERRARTHDRPDNHYYSFLYALHVRQNKMRKAADVMYEQGCRIAGELGPGAEALGLRARCLLAALNCLSLVEARHAFLVKPCGPPQQAQQAEKRNSAGESVVSEREVVVVGVEDLRRELHIVTSRLRFANTQPDKLCAETGVEEVSSMLSMVGLHASAVSLRARLGAPRAPALAALASATAALPVPADALQEAEAWRWLAQNDITDLCISERSASGAAWSLLRALVGEGVGADPGEGRGPCSESRASILHAVSSRLLSMGAFIPHWLLAEYKSLDVSSLIRLLTQHGRLSEAAAVATEAMRSARPVPYGAPAHARLVCAPLHATDLLLAELSYQAEQGDVFYIQIHEELQELVKLHCEQVQRASANLREAQTA